MAQVAAKILLDAEFAPTVWPKLQKSLGQMERNLKLGNNLFNVRNVRDFSSELDRANQRVITLGLAFQSLNTAQDILTGIAKAGIEVEKAFIEINSVFDLTSDNLDKFSKDLFNVARETSQSFKDVASAAKEFSRQGLSAEETLKRTRSALTLSRVASLDVVDAVNVLTASINGFSKAGLTSSDVINKLLAVDTKFAVSASDLSEALSRSGAAASDAGVGFNELLGIITAVQQTTARGGAVIGNSLKTIFTRIERKDTISALESLGVSVRNLDGSTKPAIELLENFAKVYDTLGDASKKSAAEIVGGVYQINILKAAIADLSRQRSIYAGAVDAAANATDEETRRNEILNKSLDSTLTRLGLASKQIGSNIANLGFSDFAKTGLNLVLNNPITEALKDASGKAKTTGGQIAEGIISGVGSALVLGLGPVFLKAFGSIARSTFSKLKTDLLESSGITASAKEQAAIQAQINTLYQSGDVALKAQLATMTSLTDKARVLQTALTNAQSAVGQRQSETGAIANILYQRGYRIPRSAGGYVPFSEESQAIRMGVGGATPNAIPKLIPNFNFGGGKVGPIVANTSEYVVPNFAGGGSAIFNQDMIRQYGMPPGAMPVSAGGYIPYAAKGKMAQLSELLKSKKFSSIVYQKPDGSKATYNAAQWRVRRDELSGGQAPEGYRNWSDFDEKTNTLVLRTLKQGEEEAKFRRFSLSRIKKVTTGGKTYNFAGGYIPFAAAGDPKTKLQILRELQNLGPFGFSKYLNTSDIFPKSAPYIPAPTAAPQYSGPFGFSSYLSSQAASKAQSNVKILPESLKDITKVLDQLAKKTAAISDYSNRDPQGLRGLDLRTAKGGTIPGQTINELQRLFYSIERAGSGDAARNLGKSVIDITQSLSEASRTKVLEKLGQVFTEFDKGLNISAIQSKVVPPPVGSAVFIPGGGGTLPPIPGSTVAGGGGGGGNRGIITAMGGLNPRNNPNLYIDPTTEERILKKYVEQLSNKQLASVVSGGRSGMGSFARPDLQQMIRGEFQTSPLSPFRIKTLVDFGKSGTLMTDFEKTVRSLVKSGTDLSDAYIKASNDFVAAGGTRKQLRTTQTVLLNSLIDYETGIKEATRQVAKTSSQQVSYNKAIAKLQSGVGFQDLDTRQRSILKSRIFGEEAQKLGFTQADILKNREARQQVLEATNLRVQSLTSSKVLPSAGARGLNKAGNFLSGTGGIAVNLGLGYLAGALPEGQGGTSRGVTLGALSGAATGASLGIAAGSAFSPLGSVIGGAIGLIGGGLVGAISKMNESLEEMTRRLQDTASVISSDFSNALRALDLEERIKIATNQGDAQLAQRLKEERAVLIQNIRDKEYLQTLGGGQSIQEAGNVLRTTGFQKMESAQNQELFQKLGFYSRETSETIRNRLVPAQILSSLAGGEIIPYMMGQQSFTTQKAYEFAQKSAFDNFQKEINDLVNGFTRLLKNQKTFTEQDITSLLQGDQASGERLAGIAQKVGVTGDFLNNVRNIDQGVGQYIIKTAVDQALAARKLANASLPPRQGQALILPEQIQQDIQGLRSSLARGQINFQRTNVEEETRQRLLLEQASKGAPAERVTLERDLSISNLRRQIQNQQQETILTGRINLAKTALGQLPQGFTQEIDTALKALRTLEDFKKLRDQLATEQGKGQLPGLFSPEISETLKQIISDLEDLNYATGQNETATKNSSQAILDQIKARATLNQALEDQGAELRRLQDLLNEARARYEPREVIQEREADVEAQKLLIEQTKAASGRFPNTNLNKILGQQYLLNLRRTTLTPLQNRAGAISNVSAEQLSEIQKGVESSEFIESRRQAEGLLLAAQKGGLGERIIRDRQAQVDIFNQLQKLRNSEITSAQAQLEIQKIETKKNIDDELDILQASITAAEQLNLGEQTLLELRLKQIDLIDQRRRVRGEISASQADINVLNEKALKLLSSEAASGAQVEQTLMLKASLSGRRGDSIGSLTGGFGAGFARIKKDMMDLSDLGANIAQSLESNLGGAFGDFVTGAKSAKEAFKSFTISVLNDVARMFASQAIRGVLGSFFGNIGVPTTPAGSTGGEFTGKAFRFAAGGKVPALLTGGEYVFNPQAAKEIGYDTLKRINRYANGGMVMGGSGVKDDVPARLAPGSFVVKKSVVDRLGSSYFDALANGGVQKRFLGGFIGMPMLYGALIGGGIGYATGGKKGAIGGALLGGIAGGMYGMQQTAANTALMQPVGPDGAALQVNSAATLSPAMQGVVGVGATVGLGLLAQGMSKPKKESQAISLADVPRYASALEQEERIMMGGGRDRFAYLTQNSSGGYSLGSFGAAPATRRFAEGGEVGSTTPLSIGPSGGGDASGPVVNVKIEINNNGDVSSSSNATGSKDGAFGSDFGQKMEKVIRPLIQDELVRQMRNDGLFSQRSRYVNNF